MEQAAWVIIFTLIGIIGLIILFIMAHILLSKIQGDHGPHPIPPVEANLDVL
jgi:hypothetical protein